MNKTAQGVLGRIKGVIYVEAQSSRSKKEFVSTMGIVLKETKETLFWLEIIVELRLTHQSKIDKVYQECVELSKMFTAVILTSSRSLNGVNNNLSS